MRYVIVLSTDHSNFEVHVRHSGIGDITWYSKRVATFYTLEDAVEYVKAIPK